MQGFSTLENVLMFLCIVLLKLLGHKSHISAHLASRHWLILVWEKILSVFIKWTVLENKGSVSLGTKGRHSYCTA